MLKALTEEGIRPDLLVGSSAGAINAAYFASDPTLGGAGNLEKIWRSLRRQDVFRFSLAGGLLLGVKKTATYGAGLALHGISTLSPFRQ